MLAPLGRARERRGIDVRMVPFAELAEEVGPDTKLVACSHVSWITGRVVDTRRPGAAGAPVLLDGAQGARRRAGRTCARWAATSTPRRARSGCAGRTAPATCTWRASAPQELPPPWPGLLHARETLIPFETVFRDDARRFDLGFPGEHQLAWALASIDVLAEAGMEACTTPRPRAAAWLAGRLADAGRTVAPRGDSTLVSWEDADPEAAVARLREQRIVLRNLPGPPYVRASVGAWNGRGRAGAAVVRSAEPLLIDHHDDAEDHGAGHRRNGQRPQSAVGTASSGRPARPNPGRAPPPGSPARMRWWSRAPPPRPSTPPRAGRGQSTIDASSCLGRRGAAVFLWARRTNSSAPPTRISADTTTGPAAPVPNARVIT